MILICWDTVRADHLGCYGYGERDTTPHLDRLAARSVVFEDASATAGWTKPSVPSFLTGTYPAQHGVYEGSAKLELGEVTDTLPEASVTLAEVYQAQGYQTAAFVRNAQLRRGNGFEQGFHLYRDEAGDARSIRTHGLDWIDERDTERPFFLYLHFLDAHWPYPVPDEHAQRYTDADLDRYRGRDSKALRRAVNAGEAPWSATDREILEALYDGSLHYLDEQLGRLLAGLERRGLAGETIVSVVSDHGEEFGERERLGHGHGLWESLLRVPWVLHVPGRTAERVAAPVSLVDLFPTLLAASRVVAPPSHAGVDVLAARDDARPIFAEHKAPDHYAQSLRHDALKLVRSFQPAPRPLDASRLGLGLGGRWEAQFRPTPEGQRILVELEENDGDADDPLELKGPLESVSATEVRVAGLTANRTLGTALAPTDDAEDDQLYPGRMVKLRLAQVQGVTQVTRIKIYARDTPAAYEVRGPITKTTGDRAGGVIEVGGVPLTVTATSDLPRADGGSPQMHREDVVQVLELGTRAREHGFDITSDLWTLTDSFERPTSRADPSAFEAELDSFGHRSAAARQFDATDRVLLTPDAVARLRAIGYAQ